MLPKKAKRKRQWAENPGFGFCAQSDLRSSPLPRGARFSNVAKKKTPQPSRHNWLVQLSKIRLIFKIQNT